MIGWALDRTLEDSLTREALRMALAQRRVSSDLVHHSDRGVQYASGDYTQRKPLRGGSLHEFFQASGNLSIR